jgi:6-pyruvoyltetrahydropterin/6-carboxytetrahydropterin synthase
MWELTKTFRFEAAHTLQRAIHQEASRREPDAATGMVVDLGQLEANLAEAKSALDHRLLDDLPELGPATLENLSAWIWRHVVPVAPGLVRVSVHRDSLDESCSYFGPG